MLERRRNASRAASRQPETRSATSAPNARIAGRVVKPRRSRVARKTTLLSAHTSSDSAPSPNFPYHSPGFIRTVECINFMCHKNMKIDLGPAINFISGQNGHGKSAILAALIQVFSTNRNIKGERGTCSSLRRNLADGTKAKSAKITVFIHNKGPDRELDVFPGQRPGYSMKPYQAEIYGDVIIIEREIFEKSTKLRIMDSLGNIVSTKTKDVETIKRHFCYQFDNRLVIQTQDNAKKRGDPKIMFKYFYDGSGFASIENNLEHMEQELQEQEETVKESLVPAFEEQIKTRDKLKIECAVTANNRKQYDDLQRYTAMRKWYEYDSVQGELEETVSSKSQLEIKSSTYQQARDKSEATLDELRQSLELCETGDPQLNEQLYNFNRQSEILKGNKNDIARQLESSKKDIKEMEKDIVLLNAHIDKLKTERDLDSEQEKRERLDAKVQKLEDSIAAALAEKKSIRQSLDEANRALEETQTNLQTVSDFVSDKTSQLQDAKGKALEMEAVLKNSTSTSTSDDHIILSRLGAGFVKLCQIIKAKKHKFNTPPVGPIACLVKIKPGTSDEDVKLINSFQPFAQVLRGFIVLSEEDRQVLIDLVPRGVDYSVYVMTPDKINTMECSPPESFQPIQRCLEIASDLVFQCLIEWAFIHSCAIATSVKDAVRQLKQIHGGHDLRMLAPHKSSSELIVTISQRGTNMANTRVKPCILSAVDRRVNREDVAKAKEMVVSLDRELSILKEEEEALRRLQYEQKNRLEVLDIQAHEPDPKMPQLRLALEKAIAEKDSLPDHVSFDDTEMEIDLKLQEVEMIDKQLGEARGALEKSENQNSEVRAAIDVCEREKQMLENRKKEMARKYEDIKTECTAHEDVLSRRDAKLQACRNHLAHTESKVKELESRRDQKHHEAKLLSAEPVPLDDDDIAPEDVLDHIDGKISRLAVQIKAASKTHLRDARIVLIEYEEAEDKCRATQEILETQKQHLEALRETISGRKLSKSRVLSLDIVQMKSQFDNIMRSRGASATININLERQTLEAGNYKLTNSSDSGTIQGSRSVATTSGGEYSFLQTALMSVLWNMVDAPIICLDEYEVFMDDSTRVISQKNLITALASLKQKAQAILISPTVVRNTEEDDPRFVYVEISDPSVTDDV